MHVPCSRFEEIRAALESRTRAGSPPSRSKVAVDMGVGADGERRLGPEPVTRGGPCCDAASGASRGDRRGGLVVGPCIAASLDAQPVGGKFSTASRKARPRCS